MALTPVQFAASSFDYLIAGGGTAGLTLAARLSENPKVQVGVLEAGEDHTTDPLVLNTAFTAALWDNPIYDWMFKTTPQNHASGRVVGIPRGKTLGGSSAINFYYWTHASQRDIDDWGTLGNAGWSWKDLFPYYLKSEKYHPPTSQQQIREQHLDYVNPSFHGTRGPVQNSFKTYCNRWCKAWFPTFDKLGLTSNGDPKGGLAIGAYSTLFSINPPSQNRSWSATAYYTPNAQRKNLKVLTNARVTKVNFAPSKDPKGDLTASSLTFTDGDGKSHTTAKVRSEIILSAGSLQSPQLLELSGIGDPAILNPLGIKPLLRNAAVGANLQDHLLVSLSFEVADGEETNEAFRDPKAFEEAVQQATVNHTGLLASGAPSGYFSLKQILDILGPRDIPRDVLDLKNSLPTSSSSSTVPSSSKLSLMDKLTIAKTLSPKEASFQIVYISGGTSPANVSKPTVYLSSDPATAPGKYFSLFVVLEHPFSSGSVHISSADPTQLPAVDPNYLADAKDLALISAAVLAAQKIVTQPPLSSLLKNGGTTYQPGFPSRITPTNVADFVKSTFGSEYHPMGTCAMLPRAAGGVVDARFRVYGTKNLRVVDASVFPSMVRGNLQTLVYAVAEKAADLIREDA